MVFKEAVSIECQFPCAHIVECPIHFVYCQCLVLIKKRLQEGWRASTSIWITWAHRIDSDGRVVGVLTASNVDILLALNAGGVVAAE